MCIRDSNVGILATCSGHDNSIEKIHLMHLTSRVTQIGSWKKKNGMTKNKEKQTFSNFEQEGWQNSDGGKKCISNNRFKVETGF